MEHIATQKVCTGEMCQYSPSIHNIGAMGVSELIKITEEEKIAIDNDFDPIEAPPGPYKVQPGVSGIQERKRTFIFIFLNFRKDNLVVWCSRHGQVYYSTTAGQEEWVCLL